jgi:peptidoglycan/xylan/chitin deacetylase (PgdA/CDA1 family)
VIFLKRIELDFWPGGVKHAVTFSYDDGRVEDRRLVDLFNQYNLRATFHLCSANLLEDWEFLRKWKAKFIEPEAYADLYSGHEMSVHLENHPFARKLPNESILAEVYRNRLFLENLCGYNCIRYFCISSSSDLS